MNKDVFENFADIARNMSSYFRGANIGLKNDPNFITPVDNFSGHIERLEIYDALIFLHFLEKLKKPNTRVVKGHKFIPY